MGYEINVSLNGKHLFATHERSLTNKDDMEKCLEIFRKKFPEEEGFKIMVTRWETYKRIIDA